MVRKKATPTPTLESIIASYVIAQGDQERINKNLPMLKDFITKRGIADLPRHELSRMVTRQKMLFDSVEIRANEMAKLFTRDGKVRKAKYRRGLAFCSACGMFKNYGKECSFCSQLEVTIQE